MKRKAHGAQKPRRISKIRRGYEHRATQRFARTDNYSALPLFVPDSKDIKPVAQGAFCNIKPLRRQRLVPVRLP